MPLKLSVIVPVYNAELTLRKCVDSLLAQDLSHEEYEIILVDDGSRDGSVAICDEYARSSASVIRVLHQANSGVSVARNNGVGVAHGKYIAFLDADDWWTANHVSQMLVFAEQYPDAGLWACNYIYYKPGMTRVGVLGVETGYINYPKAYFENNGQVVITGATMMRKEQFESLGGFPVGIDLGEDFILWCQVALRYPIAFLNEKLYYYNNAVSPILRLTKTLHRPERHMLFNLQFLSAAEQTDLNWKHLCDYLRVGGLLPYWMDKQYHSIASAELDKVDWSAQPLSIQWRYKMPIWLLRLKQWVQAVGSWCKQTLIRLRVLL